MIHFPTRDFSLLFSPLPGRREEAERLNDRVNLLSFGLFSLITNATWHSEKKEIFLAHCVLISIRVCHHEKWIYLTFLLPLHFLIDANLVNYKFSYRIAVFLAGDTPHTTTGGKQAQKRIAELRKRSFDPLYVLPLKECSDA